MPHGSANDVTKFDVISSHQKPRAVDKQALDSGPGAAWQAGWSGLTYFKPLNLLFPGPSCTTPPRSTPFLSRYTWNPRSAALAWPSLCSRVARPAVLSSRTDLLMLSPNLMWYHHRTRRNEWQISRRLTAGMVQRGKRAGAA